MKLSFTISFLISSLSIIYAQDQIPVCGTPNGEFVKLADDEAFVNSHELPTPIQEYQGQGKMEEFPVPDQDKGNAYVVRNPNSKIWLLIFQEWWGLNDHVKREADRYFDELGNVNVMAIDLYDGKVADNREDARNYMQAAKEDRIKELIKAGMNHAGTTSEFYTLGWCFGGGWSLKAAIIAGRSSSKCVIYYGWPETDPNKLQNLNAEVLGFFGSQDQGISMELVERFRQGMKQASKNLEVQIYDAGHAFANPSQPSYDEPAAQDAFMRTLEFFRD